KLRRLLQVRRSAADIADAVADLALLSFVQLRERLLGSMPRLPIQPGEAIQYRLAILALLRIGCADPLVDEVDYSDGRGGRGVLVRGDDEIGQRRCELLLLGAQGERPEGSLL